MRSADHVGDGYNPDCSCTDCVYVNNSQALAGEPKYPLSYDCTCGMGSECHCGATGARPTLRDKLGPVRDLTPPKADLYVDSAEGPSVLRPQAIEMNDFRLGYEFGYADGLVEEYQPEKYRASDPVVQWAAGRDAGTYPIRGDEELRAFAKRPRVRLTPGQIRSLLRGLLK